MDLTLDCFFPSHLFLNMCLIHAQLETNSWAIKNIAAGIFNAAVVVFILVAQFFFIKINLTIFFLLNFYVFLFFFSYLDLVRNLETNSYIIDYHFKDLLVFASTENLTTWSLYQKNHVYIQDKVNFIILIFI